MGSGASVLNDNRGILLTLFTIRDSYIIKNGFRLDLIGVHVFGAAFREVASGLLEALQPMSIAVASEVVSSFEEFVASTTFRHGMSLMMDFEKTLCAVS